MQKLILLLSSLLLFSCAVPVNLDYDSGYNFANIKTFRVKQKPVRVANDTRVNSPFMQQRVTTAITNELVKKGLRSSTKADVMINYYLDLKQEIESNDSYMSLGFGSSGAHSAIGLGMIVPVGEVSSNDRLILTIDIIDGRTGKLAWRASAGDYLYEGKDPESNNAMIKGLVAAILSKYPPGQ